MSTTNLEPIQREVLDQVLREREVILDRPCPSCDRLFKQTHTSCIFKHLKEDHGIGVGRAENLVYHEELLNLLEDKMKHLTCLFCDESFPDASKYQDHVKRRNHRRINPLNKEFDKFYVSNYFSGDVTSLLTPTNEKKESDDEHEAEDETWSGWEAEEKERVACLLCAMSGSNGQEMLSHMDAAHGFRLEGLQLSFHEKVQLVNFLRHMQIKEKSCAFCLAAFSRHEDLYAHIKTCFVPGQIPDRSHWLEEKYYLSTDNDTLLHHLVDEDADEE